MSKIITPPDQSNEPNSYLIINATVTDIEMVVRWLRVCGKDYTIHLYHDGMHHTQWLSDVAFNCKHIIINRDVTNPEGLIPLYDALGKITWIGQAEEYASAMDYFSKNG